MRLYLHFIQRFQHCAHDAAIKVLLVNTAAQQGRAGFARERESSRKCQSISERSGILNRIVQSHGTPSVHDIVKYMRSPYDELYVGRFR